MLLKKYYIFLILGILLFLLIATAKYFFPSVFYLNSGLVLLVFYTIFFPSDKPVWIFGGLGISLIIFALFKQYPVTQETFIAESFSILVVILATLVVLKIKSIYKEVSNERKHLNALFQNATEGIILTNAKGKIVMVNPAAEELFGYTTDELLGRHIEILIPQKAKEEHVKHREGFYNKPSNRTMGKGRDLFALHSSGKEFPVEVSLSHFVQENETFVIAFIIDITARKQAEQHLINQKNQLEQVTNTIRKLNSALETKVEERTEILKKALSELELSRTELTEALKKEKELNEIKSRFLSMASHEFRTPLSSVLSSAALIGKYEKAEDQEKRNKHIRRIKDSVHHLNELLEDFLSLGKLEEGKVTAKPEMFDVKEFIDDLIEELQTILKPGQSFEFNHQGEVSIITDKKQLKNILINLVNNAAKFSPENSIIKIDSEIKEELLTIAVTDRGIGIAEEDKHNLFTSFFRGKNVTNIQGTGLGLQIVKRYLELLHGHIYIESELNKGTKVTIHLPSL